MTYGTESGVSPLADLVRAAQLPEPAERRRIRQAAGLSLKRVGEALGVSESAIWHWENGTAGQGPALENAAAYRKLLDELAAAVAS